LTAARLEVEDFLNVGPRPNVVVPANPFVETKTAQKRAKIVESDAGIGSSQKDAVEYLV